MGSINTWVRSITHGLRSVVVAVESQAIVLSWAVATIIVTHIVVGKQLVLLVGLVPVTHLYPRNELYAFFHLTILVASKAVLLVESEGDALMLRLTLAITLPRIANAVHRLIFLAIFAIGWCKDCGNKVADGRISTLTIHTD